MHVYVFLCVFYAFLDVILYNFDVFLEILLCGGVLSNLLGRTLETYLELMGTYGSLSSTRYIEIHTYAYALLIKKGVF